MEVLGKPNLKEDNWMDVIEMMIFKQVEERLQAGTFVGNGTIKSAAIKAVEAGLVHAVGGQNKHTRQFRNALIYDAGEDFVTALVMPLIGGVIGGVTGQQQGNRDPNNALNWN